MKQTVEEAAREAIHKHYNCNGTYPCSDAEICIPIRVDRLGHIIEVKYRINE